MKKHHNLLARQIKACFGAAIPASKELADFIAMVDAAYFQSDDDRGMVERSLDLSSKELLARNADMRAVLQAFPDVFFRIDRGGAILDCTTGRPADLYCPRELLIGRRIQSIFPEDVSRDFEKAISRAYATRQIVSLEYPLTVPSGENFWEARFVAADNGTLLMVVRNISERIKTEKALQQSEARFRQAQKMEAVGRLAGGIAHDFNNLLTTILGLTELAIKALPEEHEIVPDLKEIGETGRRAANLTRQLLAFSRRQTIAPKLVDFNSIVLDIVQLLRRLIGEDVKLVTRLGSNGTVLVDPGQMEQLIVNLAVNARDAMPGGGELTVETADVTIDDLFVNANPGASLGSYIKLAISDTGAGMSDDVLAHLFEPFFTTKAPGKGTGLGLATCYGIAKQNNGYIAAQNNPRKGATFMVFLPRQLGDPEQPQENKVQSNSRGSESILVVEDEKPVRTLISRILRELGYSILEACNGNEGISMVESDAGKKIKLVISDMIMPELSGRQMADSIQRIRPELKVLFMTGYTDDVINPQGALSSGQRRLIHKPFVPADFAESVRAMLDDQPERLIATYAP